MTCWSDKHSGKEKISKKNEHKIDFSNFIKNWNSDLKLVFEFDNENGKGKESQDSISF